MSRSTIMDTMEQSIKINPFSGKRSDWQAWEEKFLARA